MARIEEIPSTPVKNREHQFGDSFEPDDDELNLSDLRLQAGRPGARPRPSSSRAKRQQAQSGIGGGLVDSMKRGYGGAGSQRRRGGEGERSEFRTKILLFIAFALFLILSGIWITRIFRRLNSGGHMNLGWDWSKTYSVMSPLDRGDGPSLAGGRGGPPASTRRAEL